MNKTFGQLRSSLDSWARESVDLDVGRDALNDAIEWFWMRVIQAQIESMMGGPVNLTVAAASERTQLVSIPDPIAAPVVVGIAGGTLAQHQPFTAYTIVTDSGSETLLSPIISNVVIPVNQVAQVSPPVRVPNAYGWNLYASNTAQANMSRQNDAPLSFGQNFIEPADTGFTDPGDSQEIGQLPPSENSTADDIFYIRTLEVPLSAGGFKRWDNSSIDSMMMKYATRSIASTSEYQPYYWDLINNRQLEYRPALGIAFNSRYFFVHKPRRINFDGATIPFFTIPFEEAVRSKAIAAWKLTQDEFQSHQAWTAVANQAAMDAMMTLRQQDWNKDIVITPFTPGG